jgi:hypothetical protein
MTLRSRRVRGSLLSLIVAALVAAAFGLWPVRSTHAGAVDPVTDCGCTANATGIGGHCWGSLRCFRTASDPTAEAMFSLGYASGYQQFSFYGKWAKTDYRCRIADTNQAVRAATTIGALGDRDDFWVDWDAEGTCIQVYRTFRSSY